ncbi:polysaccharide deacetylase family protein [Streptomyces sp. NPDC059979]|uniref:polysaccharide deacetylase family protein n=1 Tax=Streptomyces sp. NPDC059979 TaxID=3347021 RepID=UPI0036B8CDAD
MLYSGISWSADGITVDVIDERGERRQPSRLFGPRHTQELIRYLHGFAGELAAVVDSTNGVLDGRMMAEGLTVYRADPQHLGERPPFAAAPAEDIAAAARRGLGALTRLERHRGTQTGREPDLAEFARISEQALAEATERRTCVSRGSGERREISLTFDDGPQPPYTGQVLDILRRYDVPATFFCTGMYATAYPEYLARMLEEGHGIGNHTWSHPLLFELTRPQLVEQLDRTNEAIAVAAGGRAPTLFRPPTARALRKCWAGSPNRDSPPCCGTSPRTTGRCPARTPLPPAWSSRPGPAPSCCCTTAAATARRRWRPWPR